MSDERPVNHINLKDALRSFSQDSKVLLLEDADVAVLFGRALAEIEKLEAEVERLRVHLSEAEMRIRVLEVESFREQP